jgi:hypothetical protein
LHSRLVVKTISYHVQPTKSWPNWDQRVDPFLDQIVGPVDGPLSGLIQQRSRYIQIPGIIRRSSCALLIIMFQNITANTSPTDCGNTLDEIRDLKEQLIFLLSMEPDQQISTLASAKEKTRDSILISISELSRGEICRHLAAFQATKYQPWSTIPEELTSMILENLVPGPGEEWSRDDTTTVSSVLLVCRRWHAITIPILDGLYMYLDAERHSLSARMVSGPTNAELSEPSFCNCHRGYCKCAKKYDIGPLWASIKGSQTRCRLTLHMKYGSRPGSHCDVGFPHDDIFTTAGALLQQHNISQLEVEVIIWTTMAQAKYSFNWYTKCLDRCYEYNVFDRRAIRITRILFQGPDIHFECAILHTGKILGNTGWPWSFMDFQKFVDWHGTLSDAFLNPNSQYAVLQCLDFHLLEQLDALRGMPEIEDSNLRAPIALARKLGLV